MLTGKNNPPVPDSIWYYRPQWGEFHLPCSDPVKWVGNIYDVYLFKVRPLFMGAYQQRKPGGGMYWYSPTEAVQGESKAVLQGFYTYSAPHSQVVPLALSELLNKVKDDYIRNMYLHFVKGVPGICTFAVEAELLKELQLAAWHYHKELAKKLVPTMGGVECQTK
jgi:hypothetical protein